MFSTSRHIYLFSTLSILIISCLSSCKKQETVSSPENNIKNSSNLNCFNWKTGSILKINNLGVGIEELVAISPCKTKRLKDNRGRTWQTDDKGRVFIPKQITPQILLPPSSDTIEIDASLASRLFTQGYYFHSLRRFLGVLQLKKSGPSKDKITKYFCSLWSKMRNQGANWKKVINKITAMTIEKAGTTTLINISHGFKLSYIGGKDLFSKPIEIKKGLSLSMVTVKFNKNKDPKSSRLLIVTAKDSENFNFEKLLKMESIKWKKEVDGIYRGILKKDEIQKITYKKGTIQFILILIGKNNSINLNKIRNTTLLFTFNNPCLKILPKTP